MHVLTTSSIVFGTRRIQILVEYVTFTGAVDFEMVLDVLESLFMVFVKFIKFISFISRFNVAFNIFTQYNSTRNLLSFNEIKRDILDLLIYVYVLPIA